MYTVSNEIVLRTLLKKNWTEQKRPRKFRKEKKKNLELNCILFDSSPHTILRHDELAIDFFSGNVQFCFH